MLQKYETLKNYATPVCKHEICHFFCNLFWSLETILNVIIRNWRTQLEEIRKHFFLAQQKIEERNQIDLREISSNFADEEHIAEEEMEAHLNYDITIEEIDSGYESDD